MSIDVSRSSAAVDYDRLEVLGSALREARISHHPPLTLMELGADPNAPRRWSHSHLSKVERGLEIPKEDLVRWYEVRTKKPTGYLIKLWYQAMRDVDPNQLHAIEPGDHTWTLDRLELFVDLTGIRERVYEKRDLIARVSGLSSRTVAIDSHEVSFSSNFSHTEVLEGGTHAKSFVGHARGSVDLEIDLGREFHVGEWHRIRLLHCATAGESLPRHLSMMTRHSETRELIVSVAFKPTDVRNSWMVYERFLSEVEERLAAHYSTSARSFIGLDEDLVPDCNGLVSYRFESLRPGLLYGIGWD